jgi:solute carrier family 25 (mitochondrial iron transporter), member 28/37
VYEAAKEALGGNRSGYQWLPTAGAGALATVVNDAIMTPVDVVKQRLQASGAHVCHESCAPAGSCTVLL